MQHVNRRTEIAHVYYISKALLEVINKCESCNIFFATIPECLILLRLNENFIKEYLLKNFFEKLEKFNEFSKSLKFFQKIKKKIQMSSK